jgi:GMP synthase-like glutamine amidotransferase
MASANPAGSPRVLILDYSVDRSEAALFRKGFPEGTLSEAVFVSTAEDLPDPGGFTHVMHTGSSLSICGDAPFMVAAEDLIRRLADSGIPQLGICYGHQLLCRALVGIHAVRRAPGGLEMGWCAITQTGDPVEVPEAGKSFTVLQSHFDEVVEMPSGSEIVMTGGGSRVQGFVNRGMKLFGMQFHPEFDRDTGNRMFRKDRALVEGNGLDLEQILAGGPSIDSGRIFFGHFLERFSP